VSEIDKSGEKLVERKRGFNWTTFILSLFAIAVGIFIVQTIIEDAIKAQEDPKWKPRDPPPYDDFDGNFFR